MDNMLNRILTLIDKKHGATKELAKYLEIHPSVITDWKAGRNRSYTKYAPKIAEYYGVSLDWLSGLSDEKEKPVTLSDELLGETFIKFPVVGSILAGNGCLAYEECTGEYAYFPTKNLHLDTSDYFVLRVRGDSMYPKLLDGDYVLVQRKSYVEAGKIAVVIYNGEEATIKKIDYDLSKRWVDLVPINPEYQTRRIEGSDLEQFRFLGEVIKLQRDL